jgi:O-antigen ligase
MSTYKLNFSETLKCISTRNLALFLFAFFLSVSNSISSIVIIFFFISLVNSKNLKTNLKRVIRNKVNQSILVFFLYVLLSYFWKENNFFQDIIIKYSILLLVPLLDILNFKKRDKKVAKYFFIGGVIFNIFYSIIISSLYKLRIINNLYFLKIDHYENVFFLRGFIDHSNLSVFIAFSIFLLIDYLFNQKKNIRLNIIVFILILIKILFLLNGYGRTGLFILFALFPIYIMFKKPGKIKLILSISIVTLIILISISSPFIERIKTTFYTSQTTSNIEKIKKDAIYMSDSLGYSVKYWEEMINKDIIWKNEIIKKNEKSSLEKRFLIWKKYEEHVLNKKWFGEGAGGVKKIVNEQDVKYPHNSYIHIIIEFGIIGLLLFVNIFYSLFKNYVSEEKKNILKLIFPFLFLLCMIINDYLIIYNTACFLCLFIFLFYTEGAKLKPS